jgi:glc operon protein GlcG
MRTVSSNSQATLRPIGVSLRQRLFRLTLPMLFSLMWLWTSGAAAQSDMTARAASQIIDGCAAHAKSKGQSHAIAVYDRGGQPVAILRMDGNPPGVTDFAMQKAAAVAHWQFSTADMQTAAKETPGFGNAPRVVTVPGGVPVYSSDGKLFVGAVGVSGEAPADDAACAEAGVKAAGLSVKRKAAG